MPTTVVPLALSPTARSWAASIGTSAKDQQLINGFYVIANNQQAGTKTLYVQKRPGSTTSTDFSGTDPAIFKHYSSGFGVIRSVGTTIYEDATAIGGTGVFGGLPLRTNNIVCDAIIGGKYVLAFVDTGDLGWFLYNDAISTNFPTFTGNRTSGSAIISGIASTTGIYKGQAVSGTGIPADTRVLSVDSSTQITLTANATSGSGTATTITKEAVAKIIDAQFPALANSMEFMDGYFFVGTDNGNIYQSAINDPAEWASTDVIAADYGGDKIVFIFKVQNYIVAAGAKQTIQYFYNNGNPSGSVLSSAGNLNVIGISLTTKPVRVGLSTYCTATFFNETAVDAQTLLRLDGANNYVQILDDIAGNILPSNNLYYLGTARIGKRYLVIVHGITEPVNLVYDPNGGASLIQMEGGDISSSFEQTFSKDGVSTAFLWSAGNTWTDSGSAYPMTCQTEPKFFNQGAPFVVKSVRLIADTEASGTASLSLSKDDYASSQSMGAFDMASQNKRVWGGGYCRSSASFTLTHSANTNFRGQALVVDWDPCGH